MCFLQFGKFFLNFLALLENCFFANKEFYDLYTSNKNELVEYPLMLPRRGYDDINALEEMLKRKNMILKDNYRIYTNQKVAINILNLLFLKHFLHFSSFVV